MHHFVLKSEVGSWHPLMSILKLVRVGGVMVCPYTEYAFNNVCSSIPYRLLASPSSDNGRGEVILMGPFVLAAWSTNTV